jgi:hypothetical protein
MKSPVSLQAASDFRMAFQTLEGGLATKLVATCTIRGSIQRLMRPRKRAGRDLRKTNAAQDEPGNEQKGDSEREMQEYPG